MWIKSLILNVFQYIVFTQIDVARQWWDSKRMLYTLYLVISRHSSSIIVRVPSVCDSYLSISKGTSIGRYLGVNILVNGLFHITWTKFWISSHVTTSHYIHFFYISTTIYWMKPGTIYTFLKKDLHHLEVHWGTSNYAAFEITLNGLALFELW